jgi:hypothetical protein
VSTALILAALTLGGCTAATGGSDGSSTGSSVATGSTGDSPTKTPGGGSDTSASNTAASETTATGRQLITTGTMSVTVGRPATAAESAVRIVEAAGGRIDGRVERAATKTQPGSAKLTARIPSASLNSTIDELKTLGRLESIDLTQQDVTAESKDLDARIGALRTSVARLTDLMTRAATTADLIAIESSLATRQSELESLESQKRSITDRVDLSTVTLLLGSVAAAPKPLPATFLSGLSTGFDAFVGFLSGLLVVVGVLIPWLVFLAVLAAIAWQIRRVRRARQAQSASPGAE